MTDEPDPFPVDAPADAPAKGWTPERRAAFGAKMKAAKAAKREERERSGASTGGGSVPKDRTRSSRPAAPTAELQEIETSIVEGLTKLGAAATPILPIPGVYTIRTAEDIGGIMTRLAAKNPTILKALSGSSTVMDWVGLGVWVGGMYVAVQVQRGAIPADSPAAQNYNLTEIAVEFYGDRLYAAEPEPEATVSPVEGSGSAWDAFAVPVPPDVAEAEARALA